MRIVGAAMAAALLFGAVAGAGEAGALLEIKELDVCARPKPWRLEANVRAAESPEKVDGHPALELTFNIVHLRPDGQMKPAWPHAFLPMDPEKNDWSAYDNFEFQVYTTFNRVDEDYLPFALSVQNGEKKYSGHIPLDGLVQNQWVKFSLPVSGFPAPHNVRRLGFHASGAKYRHGDVLTTRIGGFRLTRAKVPQVAQCTMLTPGMFRDRPQLAVELTVAGPAEELGAGLPVRILSEGKPAWTGVLPVERGRKRYELNLAEAKLKPGRYVFVLFPDAPERRVESGFLVVESPWDGEK